MAKWSTVEVMVNQEFWKDKKVFITGHTGFKGSWLSIWLQHMGAEVCGYSLDSPTEPNNFTISSVSAQMLSVIDDTRNRDAVFRVMQNFEPEIVFHLAAQPLVRESYTDPFTTYETNVMGTLNVLDAARQTPSVKSIVNVTTDKCYENREWAWGYREDEPMGGYDPYSSSKGCSELLTSAFKRSYDMPLASARAGNVIGGGDWAADRIVPDTLRAFSKNENVVVRYPDAIRPWQHVLEPLSGYLLLAERVYEDKKYCDAWNFGPNDDDAKPVRDILDHMKATWGEGVDWETDGGEHPHEAHYLKLDISKAKTYLNWHPRWTLAQALDATVEWHKAWLNNENMREVTIKQINRYMNGEHNE